MISSVLITIYLNLRFTVLENSLARGWFLTFFYCFNVIFITLGSFFNEKFDRALFYKRKKDEESLMRFQEIIKNALPCGIGIYKDGNFVFSNSECARMLDVNSNHSLIDRFKEIIISESKIEQSYEPQISRLDSEMMLLKRADTEYVQTLFKHLKEEKENFIGLSTYENFIGILRKKVDTLSTEGLDEYDRFFEIKIRTIPWEGSDAQIIIIAEDFFRQRMKYMADQAKYKDQLLATVSHDLRTPLTGVIGILELTIEEDLNFALKNR